jgi:hypothetical protein
MESALAGLMSQGFAVLPGLLSAADVAALNRAVEDDQAAAPGEWVLSVPQSGGLAAGDDRHSPRHQGHLAGCLGRDEGNSVAPVRTCLNNMF